MGKSNRKQVKGLDPTVAPVQTPAFGARLSEADLERQCSDLLALDGWRTLKTDPVSRREWGKGFGELGMADRLYIRYGIRYAIEGRGYAVGAGLFVSREDEVMWIEWKRPDGRNKQHQKKWQRDERIRGALVLVAREDFPATFEGFCAWYAGSGLMRRAGLCSTSSKDATNAPRAE